ncbi:MAG: lysine exporter LysO family protein [Moraxella sp.]|nr:lysine exporter LysO family protein [Moraxella sp.]
MQNFLTLVLILLPMFVGFFVPNTPSLTKKSEQGLNYLVFIILIVIGIELGFVENISQKVGDILIYLGCLLILTIGFGSLGLYIFEKVIGYPYPKNHHANTSSSHHLLSGLIQPMCILVGFVMAKSFPMLYLPQHIITALLMALLFLVGICLNGSGISLKQALFNRYGVKLSLVFMGATLMGGAMFSLMFKEVSLWQGLALASGFGWYSLSGTVMTEAYGVIWGSVALFNDLGRELLALVFIPHVMRYRPAVAIGLGGVTSLDFTLPVLTQSGGIQITPLVVSFGFITNVVSPILMVVFSAIG